MKREILSSFLSFILILFILFFFQKKHTKEINHPWVWFIVRESILCSAFLFYFILLLHLLRERRVKMR
jgi:ABC-type multidrug transport system permease subunit